nr:hypothetical protein [Paraburkholderia mimosarum]
MYVGERARVDDALLVDFVEQLEKLEFGNSVRRYQPAGRARTGVAGNTGA